LRNLNGVIQWETHWAILRSPAIVDYFAAYDLAKMPDISPDYLYLITSHAQLQDRYRRSPVKTWEFASTDLENKFGTFDGTLILLTNRRVLSAGEGMVGASQSFKNQIVIGENTGGVAQFSSSCGYYLPHSKFIVNLPRQLILIPGLEECIGYAPDYWLDTVDPVNEVFNWLKNPDFYQFSFSKPFNEWLKKASLTPSLPDGVEIITPSVKVPKPLRQFSGKWFGITDGVLDHLLVVEAINDDLTVNAIYAWGVAYQWNINEPGWRRFDGEFENQNLVLTGEKNDLKITYTLNPDGTLHSIYERPGIVSHTTLHRVTADDF